MTERVIFFIAWGLILYTYAGFPILLALYARFFGARHAVTPIAEDDLPTVALVVAAFNEQATLAAKLANTWALDYPAHKLTIYIGSDGSNDETNAILQACADRRLRAFLFTERRGKISVLNDLMREADAEIVLMSDANTMIEPGAVRKLVAHFQNPKVGCVSGELLLEQNGGSSGEGLYWKYEGWIKRTEGRLGFLIGCNGGIFAIRKPLYEALPPTTIVEDFVLTLRILEKGHEVHFEPKARAFEPACVSPGAEMVRKIRIGAGGFQALQLNRALLHPRFGMRAFAFWGHKVLRWFVPHFYLAALIANLTLCAHRGFQAFLMVQMVGAGVALLSYRMPEGKALPRWMRPVSYFYLMNYALGCGFLRFLMKKQRVTWDRAASASAPALRLEQRDAA